MSLTSIQNSLPQSPCTAPGSPLPQIGASAAFRLRSRPLLLVSLLTLSISLSACGPDLSDVDLAGSPVLADAEIRSLLLLDGLLPAAQSDDSQEQIFESLFWVDDAHPTAFSKLSAVSVSPWREFQQGTVIGYLQSADCVLTNSESLLTANTRYTVLFRSVSAEEGGGSKEQAGSSSCLVGEDGENEAGEEQGDGAEDSARSWVEVKWLEDPPQEISQDKLALRLLLSAAEPGLSHAYLEVGPGESRGAAFTENAKIQPAPSPENPSNSLASDTLRVDLPPVSEPGRWGETVQIKLSDLPLSSDSGSETKGDGKEAGDESDGTKADGGPSSELIFPATLVLTIDDKTLTFPGVELSSARLHTLALAAPGKGAPRRVLVVDETDSQGVAVEAETSEGGEE